MLIELFLLFRSAGVFSASAKVVSGFFVFMKQCRDRDLDNLFLF